MIGISAGLWFGWFMIVMVYEVNINMVSARVLFLFFVFMAVENIVGLKMKFGKYVSTLL